MAQYDFFDPSGRGTGIKGGIEASNKLFDGIEQRKINAMKMMGVEDAQRRNAMTEDVKTAEVLLKNKDTKGAMEFLSDRAQASSQSGGNPRETMEVYNTIRDGNVPEALDMLANYRSVFDDGYTDERQSSQAKTNYVNKVSPPQTDQETGQQYVIITDPNTETTRRVDVAGGKALTQDAKDTKLVRRSLLDDARKVSRESFEGLKTVRSGLGAYQDALTAIENNASSGKLQSFFPSFTEATINLENAGARLGLNVIQATTFGALSEGELKLAMDTAMPPLEPVALKKWIIAKRDAQKKLGRELRKMSIELGKGKTTIAEYLENTGYAEQDLATDDELMNKYGVN
jgi:hypothetical protein